jgi:hypothetical protein
MKTKEGEKNEEVTEHFYGGVVKVGLTKKDEEI